MIRAVVMLPALFGGAVTAAELQQAVPARYQGEWNANPEHCGTGLDESRLRIAADRIHFYESSGPVAAVVTQGELELALVVELSGEGDTWLSVRHFRLSEDRVSLTDVTSPGGSGFGFVRYRCPEDDGRYPSHGG